LQFVILYIELVMPYRLNVYAMLSMHSVINNV